MNKAEYAGTLLMIMLMIGLFAASAVAFNYYDLAKRSDVRAKSLNDKLWVANNDLSAARSQLAEAQSKLGQAQIQLSQQQSESQRRLQVIFAQQENVKILKSCLAGVVADDDYFRKGVTSFFRWADSRDDDDYRSARDNFEKGKEILDSVNDDCQRADALFK